MSDGTCLLVPLYSQPSESSVGSDEVNPHRCLGQSISFGRFESEPLSWEKRSAFSRNRFLEEAQKYAKPGSVAKMKAHFEAHFKRVAAAKKVKHACQSEVFNEEEEEVTGCTAAATHQSCDSDSTVVALQQTSDQSFQIQAFNNYRLSTSSPIGHIGLAAADHVAEAAFDPQNSTTVTLSTDSCGVGHKRDFAGDASINEAVQEAGARCEDFARGSGGWLEEVKQQSNEIELGGGGVKVVPEEKELPEVYDDNNGNHEKPDTRMELEPSTSKPEEGDKIPNTRPEEESSSSSNINKTPTCSSSLSKPDQGGKRPESQIGKYSSNMRKKISSYHKQPSATPILKNTTPPVRCTREEGLDSANNKKVVVRECSSNVASESVIKRRIGSALEKKTGIGQRVVITPLVKSPRLETTTPIGVRASLSAHKFATPRDDVIKRRSGTALEKKTGIGQQRVTTPSVKSSRLETTTPIGAASSSSAHNFATPLPETRGKRAILTSSFAGSKSVGSKLQSHSVIKSKTSDSRGIKSQAARIIMRPFTFRSEERAAKRRERQKEKEAGKTQQHLEEETKENRSNISTVVHMVKSAADRSSKLFGSAIKKTGVTQPYSPPVLGFGRKQYSSSQESSFKRSLQRSFAKTSNSSLKQENKDKLGLAQSTTTTQLSKNSRGENMSPNII